MQSYEAARGLFNFLSFCSWVVIICGGIGAIAGAGALGAGAGGLQMAIGLAPGAAFAIIGFYGLALVQMGRAGVDSAEYSQQALKVARDQLEVARQSLLQNQQMAASYMTIAPKKVPVAAEEDAASAEPEAGASYGNRPETAATNVAVVAAPAAALAATADAAAAPEIEQQTVAALPQRGIKPTLDLTPKETVAARNYDEEVVYKDGKYFAGGKRFWSRVDAVAHLKELA